MINYESKLPHYKSEDKTELQINTDTKHKHKHKHSDKSELQNYVLCVKKVSNRCIGSNDSKFLRHTLMTNKVKFPNFRQTVPFFLLCARQLYYTSH